MNTFFSESVKNLGIKGYLAENCTETVHNDEILNVAIKFRNHPSILQIKDKIQVHKKFSFAMSTEDEILIELNLLNINKPTTFNNIPAKILVDAKFICSPYITKIYNDSKNESKFPGSLKMADISPVHKKDDLSNKTNNRPVSILPFISKIFERDMYNQICLYMDEHLSHFLCGFRKGYSAQHCLSIMLERRRKALDKSKLAGALLTDLSKAFDCLNHGLLIAKLEAYGFDHKSLSYINSYLSGRKQRTKVNNSFSSWNDIKSGIPQGSILGPLLFNIYLNDIFYFVNENNLTNYADDNSPYAIDSNTDALIDNLVKDSSTLIKWFNDNYFKMNPDKCRLLITNHVDDISTIIDGEIIKCSKSVKLLGIKGELHWRKKNLSFFNNLKVLMKS